MIEFEDIIFGGHSMFDDDMANHIPNSASFPHAFDNVDVKQMHRIVEELGLVKLSLY